MRFVSRQPADDTNVNVSKTHPLVEAGTLFVGLTLIFVALAVALVFFVDLALRFVSVESEAELFQSWLPDDLATVAPQDERLAETQMLVDRLAAHWPESAYEFRVEISNSEVPNAMAFPGGLIVVTEGLLQQVESENELAFVLGHELGHFKNRDHLRALGRGVVMSVAMAALTGGDASGVGIKVADITLLGFSRGQESAADEFGLDLVYAEYGHVNEAWRLFERWEIDDTATTNFVSYLSTHPNSGNRVAKILALAAERDWPHDGEVRPLPWPAEPRE